MTAIETEVLDATRRMLKAMHDKDVDTYRACCADDVSAFEWYITPYRVDGIDFHLSLIAAGGNGAPTRIDLLTPRVQIHGESAVVTYTLLKTFAPDGKKPAFTTTNETRVFVRTGGAWKMVHLHKSPTGSAARGATELMSESQNEEIVVGS
ncbi:MAG: nuclear transport factor 2 family protein [Capsulimonadaceae bacterium]